MGLLGFALGLAVDFFVLVLVLAGTIIELFSNFYFGLFLVATGAAVQVAREALSLRFFKGDFSARFILFMLVSAGMSFLGLAVVWLLRGAFSERSFGILLLNASVFSLIALVSVLAKVATASSK